MVNGLRMLTKPNGGGKDHPYQYKVGKADIYRDSWPGLFTGRSTCLFHT